MVSRRISEGQLTTRMPKFGSYNVQQVRDPTLWSMCMSTTQQALTQHLKECSVRRILHKDLHYHPHNIQVGQELSEQEKVSRLVLQWILRFGGKQQQHSEHITNVNQGSLPCVWLCEENRTVATGLQNIYMNFTNILCIAKVTVRCAVSSHGITGPYCSENAEGHNLNVNTM